MRRLHLRRVRRRAAALPAPRHDLVGDEFHGPELLLDRRDGQGVPEEDRGAVVVGVRVGGEGQDEAVDLAGGDADGEALGRRVGAVLRGGGAREVHEAAGDVAVEVAV